MNKMELAVAAFATPLQFCFVTTQFCRELVFEEGNFPSGSVTNMAPFMPLRVILVIV